MNATGPRNILDSNGKYACQLTAVHASVNLDSNNENATSAGLTPEEMSQGRRPRAHLFLPYPAFVGDRRRSSRRGRGSHIQGFIQKTLRYESLSAMTKSLYKQAAAWPVLILQSQQQNTAYITMTPPRYSFLTLLSSLLAVVSAGDDEWLSPVVLCLSTTSYLRGGTNTFHSIATFIRLRFLSRQ